MDTDKVFIFFAEQEIGISVARTEEARDGDAIEADGSKSFGFDDAEGKRDIENVEESCSNGWRGWRVVL